MNSKIVAALVVPYLVGREHVYNACLLRGVKATGSIVFVNSFLDFAGIDALRQQLATFQSSLSSVSLSRLAATFVPTDRSPKKFF
jgi:hypothetical protein